MDRAARVPVRAMVRRLRRELGEHADDPTYIFTKPRIGYWMPKGKTAEEETACPKRGIRQKILKTEELSETGARLGKPICAGRYRRIKAEARQGFTERLEKKKD